MWKRTSDSPVLLLWFVCIDRLSYTLTLALTFPFTETRKLHVCLRVLINKMSRFGCRILFIVSSLCLLMCEYNLLL